MNNVILLQQSIKREDCSSPSTSTGNESMEVESSNFFRTSFSYYTFFIFFIIINLSRIYK